MQLKLGLLCVSLAVLWVSVATDTGQIENPASTSTVHQPETASTLDSTLFPSRSAATRSLATATNTASSDEAFGRQRALGSIGTTGPDSSLSRNTEVKDSDYVCDCPKFWECVCKNSIGKIKDTPGYAGPVDWTFEVVGAPNTSPILIKVYFNFYDVPNDDHPWKLSIGSSTLFEDASELRNTTEVYIMSTESILFEKEVDSVHILLYYEALVPVPITETIPGNDLSGVIRFPTNASEDFELGYIQQQRQMWIFDYPANYIVEMNLTKLDLGYRLADLHWKNTYNNEIENDFLLVGLSTEIMESEDKVFYGHLDETKIIRINHPSAHVVLFSSYHEQWAGGFEISYAALEVTVPSSTTTSAPTTIAPDLGVLPSTLAPIDAALKGNYSALRPSFRSAVAGMATEYVSSHDLDVEPPSVIEPSDVVVHWTATCKQGPCSEDCVAFNFSIHKETKGRTAWAFSTPTLDAMIRDDKLQTYWKAINEECEFCEEIVTVNWYVFGGVAAGAVLLAVLLFLVVWKIGDIAAANKSKQEIEEDQRQEELERRRRSSGDESVIGVLKGGARMSLPFGAARGSVNSVPSSQGDESDDYPEHDPDLGYDNFGLGADLLNDNRARNFYSNAAFEPDTPPADNIAYKQLHQAALAAHQPSTSSQGLPLKPIPILKSSMKKSTLSSQKEDGAPKKVFTVKEEEDEDSFTDSDDSDGTVQFKSVAFGPRKQISIQADVHHPGDSEFGETVF